MITKTQRPYLIVFALILPWMLSSGHAQAPGGTGTHQVKLNGHLFTLPLGFEIPLAAGQPLIERPITACFDEEGRLYVADSSGSNDKVNVQLENKPHRIV